MPTLRLRTFAQLWAVAHLLDVAEADLSGWFVLPRLVVALIAIEVLWRPEAGRLRLLAGAQVISFVLLAPPSSNHPLLLVAVNLAILVAAIGPTSQAATTTNRWAPLARLALVVAYLAAAVSKLNSSFFDPVASCANLIASAGSLGLLDGQYQALPWLVAGAELAIFGLLAVPRTRAWGVRLGFTFHFIVSLSPVVGVRDFTATLFALFALFLADDALADARARVESTMVGVPMLRTLTDRRLVTIITVVTLVAAAAVGGQAGAGIGLIVSWMLFTLVATTIVLALWTTELGPRGAALGRPLIGQLPIVGLLAVVAAGPYLGLGTAPAFTPFSNLQTEGPGTNHFFLPSVHLIDHQNRVVWLEDTSEPELNELLVDDHFGLTTSSLRVLGTQLPDLQISGVDGETGATFSDRPVTAFGSPSLAERYLLSFRPVASTTTPRCTP